MFLTKKIYCVTLKESNIARIHISALNQAFFVIKIIALFPVYMDTVRSLVEDKPVVIFSKNSCCISHSIKQLITSYGANPTIYKLDELPNGHEIDRALQKLRCKPGVPAVFIGQKLVGGANDVISLQVQGKLVPMLMDAGAIWIWNGAN